MRFRFNKIASLAVTALLAGVSLASASSCSTGKSHAEHAAATSKAPLLAFYEIPGCPICARINTWLDELERTHPNAATVVRTPITKPGIQPEMKARGIDHHGIAILGTNGKVTWASQAHGLTQEVLTAKFQAHVIDDHAVRPMEMGCAACTYKVAGVEGCTPAVKADGKVLLVRGVEVDLHGAGLCAKAKTARVAGHVEGTEFVATSVKLD